MNEEGTHIQDTLARSVSVPTPHPARAWYGRAARSFGSLKLAVTLLSLLAVVLALGTCLETTRGAAYARWFIYDSRWFLALLGLLGLNIFVAAALRFPWQNSQLGFVVTHAGLLVLLAGTVQTLVGGVEGRLTLAEGEKQTRIVVPGRSQLTAYWVDRPEEAPYEFAFAAGPVDWPAGRTLDVGEVDGIRTRVLNFYRHARSVVDWVADDGPHGGPALRFALLGPDPQQPVTLQPATLQAVAENWLAADEFGDEIFVGPLRLSLQRATNPELLDDLLEPKRKDLGDKGALVAYFQQQARRIDVEGGLGKKIPLADDGTAVEIVEYLPNARPSAKGRFISRGRSAGNPLLELRVYLPEEDQPCRQIAFAKNPLLNLDGVRGSRLPIQFRYQHPDVQPSPGVLIVQSADGRLHSRVDGAEGSATRRDIQVGDRIETGAQFVLQVLEVLPRARRRVTFEPVEARSGADHGAQAAALLEITAAGSTRQVWLARDDMVYGADTIHTPQGPLGLHFSDERVPLGYSLELVDLQRQVRAGQVGNASLASQVRLVDTKRGIDEQRNLSVNEPLVHGKFTFYQSGFEEDGHGKEASSLHVAHDPGRTLKYTGSFMICCGIFLMFSMRAYIFSRVPRLTTSGARQEEEPSTTTAHSDPLPSDERKGIAA